MIKDQSVHPVFSNRSDRIARCVITKGKAVKDWGIKVLIKGKAVLMRVLNSLRRIKEALREFEMNGHLPLLDGNGIYNNVRDLDNWIELRDTEFGIPTEAAAYDPNTVPMDENTPFLELNDLSTPLRFPSEAGAHDWLHSGSTYAAPTYDMSIGMDEIYSGVANPCPAEVSGFVEYSAVLEEPHLLGNNLKELGKGNCNGNFEARGSDAVRDAVKGCEVSFVITEPEGSTLAKWVWIRRTELKYMKPYPIRDPKLKNPIMIRKPICIFATVLLQHF